MGVKIIQLEVENFKSIREKTTIPFSPDTLTVVVGPNGTGKSTCIEAISFVLLATLSDLRGVRGDDLLPRGDRRSNNCAVRVSFELDDQQFSLSRIYSKDSQDSRYFFNNEEVDIDDYKVVLQDYGIANALQISILKQEDINALASRNPAEWTRCFEKLSGSDSFKDEYEKARKLKDDKRKEVHRLQQTINKLKKANKSLKNHSGYTEKVTDLAVQITLAEVLGIEKVFKENIEKYKNLYEKSMELEQQLRQEVDLREMTKLGNDLSRLELSNNRILSEYQKCQESLKSIEKRINSLRESKKTFVARCEKINKNNEQLRDENENLKDQSTIIVEALQKDSPDYDATIQQDEDQMLSYYNAKENFNEIASSIINEVEDLKVEKIRLNNLLCNTKRKLGDIATEQETLKKVSTRVAELEKKLQAEKDLGETDKVQEELNQIWNKQSILMSKLNDIDNQLEEFERIETKRSERTRTDSVLKAEFGNRIYGRLVDLCHPVDPKYQLAFTRIMGPLLNAIVVQSQDVAIHCVELLKEKKLSAATFMGLDDLKFEPPRTFPGLTRAYDLLKFDQSVEKAVAFAVKNTVICEDSKSASEIRTKYQVDVVCLNGTLFKKSGALYGGQAALEKQSQEWDHKLIQKLRNQQDVLQKELDKLIREAQSRRDLLIKIEQRDKDTIPLRAELECLSADKRMQQRRVEEMGKNQSSLIEENSRLVQKLRKLDNQILTKQYTIQKLKDETFHEFCQTYELSSIQEYEKNDLENYKKELEERSKLKVNQADIEYIIKTNETTIKENKEQLRKIQNRMAEIDDELKEAQKQLPKIKKQFELAAEKKNANESEMKQLTEEIKKLKIIDKSERDMEEQLNSLREKLFFTKQKIFELKNKRYEILLDAIEIHELPLNLKDVHRPADLNADKMTETSSLEEILEPGFNYELDFSDLPDHVQEKDTRALKEYREKLEAEKEKLEKTIDMNIKQAELIKAGEGVDLVEITTELEDLKKDLTNVNQTFEEIGRKRSDKLANYIQQIQENLNETYQTITENSSGKIELISLNAEEIPFLAGIALYCQLPEKRTREIKELSGGEKAAAIFSLYLAINKMNSSFFLTDEVDAALDIDNVKSMCESMENATDSVQVIGTTFNEDIIEKAENLIGTYLDENGGTKILTL